MTDINTVLAAYLQGADEATRHAAYELGRRALAQGVGLMEWIECVYGAVVRALATAKSRTERERAVRATEGFLLECLSAYEMAFRGAREANDALRRQNELLEGEARRIAHEIHDSAGQVLVPVHMELQRLAKSTPAEAATIVSRASALLDEAHAHLRRFAHELRPTILDDLGLIPALRALGDGVAARAGIAVRVEGSTEGRLPAPVEVALYRTVQEALTNTVKHARAARADVHVARRDNEIRCTVTDDGVGFPAPDHRTGGRGLGLIGLRERIAPLGGNVRWGSAPRAGGAVVTVTIPLETPYAGSHSGR